MKRLLTLLCAMLLLTGMACAEFDFTPYELQGRNAMNTPLLLDEHMAAAVTYANNDGDAPRYITWWRDGQTVREVQLPDNMNTLWPQQGENGEITWLYFAEPDEPTDPEAWPRVAQLRGFQMTGDYTAHDYQLTDKLIHMSVHSHNGYFMYREWIDNEMWCTIRSTAGEALMQFAVNFRNFSNTAFVNRCVYNNDGSCWLTVCDSGTAWLYLVDPSYHAHQIAEVNDYPGISSDGKGGIFFSQSVGSGTYKPTQITHYDRSGANLGSVTLSGKDVLLGFTTHPQADGNVLLCGKAVANSRKVYLVWRVLCDSDLRPISDYDVREFNYHGDYGFGSQFTSDGTWYLFSNGIGKGVPSVLVPFDVLPTAKNPGLTIR